LCAVAAPKILSGDRVIMSLRGSETTEAISSRIDCIEIAALTSFARNDKEESWHTLKCVAIECSCRYHKCGESYREQKSSLT
jgi:hypothetical protein